MAIVWLQANKLFEAEDWKADSRKAAADEAARMFQAFCADPRGSSVRRHRPTCDAAASATQFLAIDASPSTHRQAQVCLKGSGLLGVGQRAMRRIGQAIGLAPTAEGKQSSRVSLRPAAGGGM